MSQSGILTFGLAKERFHQLGQFLDPAQSAEGQPLHFVFGLHQLPGDLALDVRPDLFVRVQLRRVRRQVEQFEPAVLSLDKGLDQLRLVNRMTIDNQEHRLRCPDHQALEEFPEDFRVYRALMQHEGEPTCRNQRNPRFGV